MKKTLAVLTLGSLLLFGTITQGFAGVVQQENTNSNFTRGNGQRLCDQNLSKEELLKQKIEIIDEYVNEGKITKEEGEKYKETITKRMNECTTIGENRDKNERLGIGFGRGNGQGMRGRGNGQGKGFCRNIAN